MIAFVGKFKVVALALSLSSFIPQCLGITNFAYAQGARGMEQSAKGVEHPDEIADAFHGTSSAYGVGRFAEILEELQAVSDGIREKVAKGKSLDFEREVLRLRRLEVLNLDKEIREEFKATEKFLKDKKLSKALNRHKGFVKSYEKKFKRLIAEIAELIVTEDTEKLTAESMEFIEFLKESEVKEPKIEFKPEKLPHRNLPVRNLPTEEYTPPEIPRVPLKKSEKRRRGETGIGRAGNFETERLGDKENCSGLIYQTDDFETTFKEYQNNDYADEYALACAGNITPFLFMQMPDSQYLMPTLEVQFTPEIESLAAELKHQPLNIYEYVRNNFDYEPYYGSLKGAQQTLFEGAGNDFDQASLLIALLRVSGIHARYARGEAIIPIELAMKWLKGVKRQDLVGKILATNGISGTYLQSGGQIVAVKIDHVWVEAYVDYEPSRGAVHRQGDTWLPLDPSFKTYSYVQGIDISQNVIFNEDEYLDTIRIESPMDFYLNDIREYFEANYPDTTFFAGVSGAVVKRLYLGYLPAGLPYKIGSGLPYWKEERELFAEISDADRHRVDFAFTDVYGNVSLSYSARTPEIAGEGIALFFKPASAYDEQLIEQYDGLYNVPAYLLTLRPTLRIGGTEVTEGQDIGFGDKGVFSLTLHNPSGFTDYTEHSVTVGGWYGLTLNLQKIPGDVMTKVSDELIPLLEQLDLSDTLAPVEIEPDWAERMLNEFGLGYFSMLDASEHIFAGFNDIVLTKYISECLTVFNVSVEYLYGLPYDVDQTGVLMDAAKVILNPFNRNYNLEVQKQWQNLTGFEGSYLEHNLFELWMRLPSISAIKALEIANVEGLPIYLIDSGNIGQIMPLLELPNDLKEEIQNSVNAGMEVKVSQTEIQFLDWVGAGYLIRDPETGAGAYKISGGYAGGGSGGGGHTNNGAIAKALNLNGRRALVCLGDYPEEYVKLTSGLVDVLQLIDCYMAYRSLSKMWHLVFWSEPKTKNKFREKVKKNYRVLFFHGHGVYRDKNKNGKYDIGEYVGLQLDRNGKTNIYITPSEIEPITNPYKFVFLNSCFSADPTEDGKTWGGSFGAEAWIGWTEEPIWIHIAMFFAQNFWAGVEEGETVGESYNYIQEYLAPLPGLGQLEKAILDGNPELRLTE